jgi:hypothetical protein
MRMLRQLVAPCIAVVLAACSVDPATFTLADDPPAGGQPGDNPPGNNPPADGPPADGPPADGPPSDGPRAEDCSTRGDEDGNGLADCEDPVCASAPLCQPVPHHGLRITTTGAGRGTITATVDGAPCDAACLDSLPAGTPVQLAATAAPGSWFHGWVAGCDGRHTCNVVSADDLTITGDFTDEPNRVFVSSIAHDGNFGGLSGGDAICQQLATQAGLIGEYRILLSIPSAHWRTRLGGARGWIRVDGEPVGDSTLGGDAGLYNIRIDERGNDVGLGTFWAIGTTTISGSTYCTGWSSNAGGSTADRIANASFTTRTAILDGQPLVIPPPCSQPNRFLCAEVDRQVTVVPIPTSGRLAFVTAGRWNTTAELASADALCSLEAGAATRPGRFKAFLSTSTASALSRFDTSGPPWVRADGLPLLATAKTFESATYLDIAPGMRLDRTVLPAFTVIPFGAQSLVGPGSLGTTCNDWKSSTNTNVQGFSPWDTDPRLASTSCGVSLPVLCLQD